MPVFRVVWGSCLRAWWPQGAPVFAQSSSKRCDHEEPARGSSCHHSFSVSLAVPRPGWAPVGTGGSMPSCCYRHSSDVLDSLASSFVPPCDKGGSVGPVSTSTFCFGVRLEMRGESRDFGCNLSAPVFLGNEGTSLHKKTTGKQRAQ